ncbi:MAG: histidine phosphatase family protein [Candidatus Nanopelagicales bacterium]|nr:histidine phosphatase family protein [Candidatus Nanopelagicales bacterium]
MALGTLVLLRHAKSAYPSGVTDHDRPLSPRGERDAVAAGLLLRDHRDAWLGTAAVVLVSTALRAQATWSLASGSLPGIEARSAPRLYEASVSTLIDEVAPWIEAGSGVLVVAHNPGVEELAAFLTGASDSDLRRTMRAKYPTAGIAVLQLHDARWSDTSASLIDFLVPRG